jgi:hypothetical protein
MYVLKISIESTKQWAHAARSPIITWEANFCALMSSSSLMRAFSLDSDLMLTMDAKEPSVTTRFKLGASDGF